MPEAWDRDAALADVDRSGLTADSRIVKRMWVYHHDLEIQISTYARAKTYYERTKATLMVSLMAADETGKKMSAAAAEPQAESDPDVWNAALAYRMSEQMIAADKAALAILHGELEAWRTRKADERAADSFTARVGT